jgi:hypothetical protein
MTTSEMDMAKTVESVLASKQQEAKKIADQASKFTSYYKDLKQKGLVHKQEYKLADSCVLANQY